jgi:hypothetical protein
MSNEESKENPEYAGSSPAMRTIFLKTYSEARSAAGKIARELAKDFGLAALSGREGRDITGFPRQPLCQLPLLKTKVLRRRKSILAQNRFCRDVDPLRRFDPEELARQRDGTIRPSWADGDAAGLISLW